MAGAGRVAEYHRPVNRCGGRGALQAGVEQFVSAGAVVPQTAAQSRGVEHHEHVAAAAGDHGVRVPVLHHDLEHVEPRAQYVLERLKPRRGR